MVAQDLQNRRIFLVNILSLIDCIEIHRFTYNNQFVSFDQPKGILNVFQIFGKKKWFYDLFVFLKRFSSSLFPVFRALIQ